MSGPVDRVRAHQQLGSADDVPWRHPRVATTSVDLPGEIRQLLESRDKNAAHAAAERIEDAVCRARELYQAAGAVTRSVVEQIRVVVCSVAALDLLVEIAHWQTSHLEQVEDNDGLALRCAELIRGVLPQLHTLAGASSDEAFRQGAVDLATRLTLQPAPCALHRDTDDRPLGYAQARHPRTYGGAS